MRRRQPPTDRGQAYTLEGFIGAMAVLLAVLLALQAIVITPTTGGTIDRSIQVQQQQELQDALAIAANENELSKMIRYWDTPDEECEVDEDEECEVAFKDRSELPRGQYEPDEFNRSEFGALPVILEKRFADADGRNYNVELHYQGGDGSLALVYQGQPDTNAFTASKIVTLYDDQKLTDEDETLVEVYDDYYEDDDYDWETIPKAGDGDVYNVVEVRVVVW